MRRYLTILCMLLVVAAVSAAEAPLLFTPGTDSISSTGIHEIINGLEGSVIFATDHGRSEYTGEWSRYYQDPGNPGASPLGDFVRAIEFDAAGNLWIGYSNGLQILTPQGYITIDDQQLLRNLAVNDLKRRDGEMWVATGQVGVHRYADGNWTWYRPHSPELPGDGTIEKILIDYLDGTLYLLSSGGLFQLEETAAPEGRFEEVADGGDPLAGMKGGISDPYGGVLLFNSTRIFHLDAREGYTEVVSVGALSPDASQIFDIAAPPQGGILVGTDDGIVYWDEGNVTLHLDRGDGLPDGRVKTVYLDAQDRLWFATPSSVGFFLFEGAGPVIPISSPPEGAPVTEEPYKTPSIPEDAPLPPAPNDTYPPEEVGDNGDLLSLLQGILDRIFELFPF